MRRYACHQSRSDLGFRHPGPSLGLGVRANQFHSVVNAAESPFIHRDVIGDDPVATLARQLARARWPPRPRSRRRSRPPAAAAPGRAAPASRGCPDFRPARAPAARPPALLDLLGPPLGRRASRRPPPRRPRRRPAAPPRRPPASRAPVSTWTSSHACAGPARATGPADQRDLARRRAASAAAIAWPCRPDERLAMKRTGSIGSRVGPLVTSARTPASRPVAGASSASIAARISCGSAMRPTPTSPQAMSPGIGPDHADAVGAQLRDVAPRRRMPPHLRVHGRRDQHRLVGREQQRSRPDRRRGPPAILAIRSAVAGATTTRSASRDSRMWPISASSVSENRSL